MLIVLLRGVHVVNLLLLLMRMLLLIVVVVVVGVRLTSMYTGPVSQVVAALNVSLSARRRLERSCVVTTGEPQVVLAQDVRRCVRLRRFGILSLHLFPALRTAAASVGERGDVVSVDVGVLGVGIGVRVVREVGREELLLGRVRVLLVVGSVPTSVDPKAWILARVNRS